MKFYWFPIRSLSKRIIQIFIVFLIPTFVIDPSIAAAVTTSLTLDPALAHADVSMHQTVRSLNGPIFGPQAIIAPIVDVHREIWGRDRSKVIRAFGMASDHSNTSLDKQEANWTHRHPLLFRIAVVTTVASLVGAFSQIPHMGFPISITQMLLVLAIPFADQLSKGLVEHHLPIWDGNVTSSEHFALLRSQHVESHRQFISRLLGLGLTMMVLAFMNENGIYSAIFMGAALSNLTEGLFRGSVTNIFGNKKLGRHNFADLVIYSYLTYLATHAATLVLQGLWHHKKITTGLLNLVSAVGLSRFANFFGLMASVDSSIPSPGSGEQKLAEKLHELLDIVIDDVVACRNVVNDFVTNQKIITQKTIEAVLRSFQVTDPRIAQKAFGAIVLAADSDKTTETKVDSEHESRDTIRLSATSASTPRPMQPNRIDQEQLNRLLKHEYPVAREFGELALKHLHHVSQQEFEQRLRLLTDELNIRLRSEPAYAVLFDDRPHKSKRWVYYLAKPNLEKLPNVISFSDRDHLAKLKQLPKVVVIFDDCAVSGLQSMVLRERVKERFPGTRFILAIPYLSDVLVDRYMHVPEIELLKDANGELLSASMKTVEGFSTTYFDHKVPDNLSFPAHFRDVLFERIRPPYDLHDEPYWKAEEEEFSLPVITGSYPVSAASTKPLTANLRGGERISLWRRIFLPSRKTVSQLAEDSVEVQRIAQTFGLSQLVADSAVRRGWTEDRMLELRRFNENLGNIFEREFGFSHHPVISFNPSRYAFCAVNTVNGSGFNVNVSEISYTIAHAHINNWFLEEWGHTLQSYALGEFRRFPELTPKEYHAFFNALSHGLSAQDNRFSLPAFNMLQFIETTQPSGWNSIFDVNIAREAIEIHAAALAWALSLHWQPRPDGQINPLWLYWEDALRSAQHATPAAGIPELSSRAARWEAILDLDQQWHFIPWQRRMAIHWEIFINRWRSLFGHYQHPEMYRDLKQAYKEYFAASITPFFGHDGTPLLVTAQTEPSGNPHTNHAQLLEQLQRDSHTLRFHQEAGTIPRDTILDRIHSTLAAEKETAEVLDSLNIKNLWTGQSIPTITSARKFVFSFAAALSLQGSLVAFTFGHYGWGVGFLTLGVLLLVYLQKASLVPLPHIFGSANQSNHETKMPASERRGSRLSGRQAIWALSMIAALFFVGWQIYNHVQQRITEIKKTPKQVVMLVRPSENPTIDSLDPVDRILAHHSERGRPLRPEDLEHFSTASGTTLVLPPFWEEERSHPLVVPKKAGEAVLQSNEQDGPEIKWTAPLKYAIAGDAQASNYTFRIPEERLRSYDLLRIDANSLPVTTETELVLKGTVWIKDVTQIGIFIVNHQDVSVMVEAMLIDTNQQQSISLGWKEVPSESVNTNHRYDAVFSLSPTRLTQVNRVKLRFRWKDSDEKLLHNRAPVVHPMTIEFLRTHGSARQNQIIDPSAMKPRGQVDREAGQVLVEYPILIVLGTALGWIGWFVISRFTLAQIIVGVCLLIIIAVAARSSIGRTHLRNGISWFIGFYNQWKFRSIPKNLEFEVAYQYLERSRGDVRAFLEKVLWSQGLDAMQYRFAARTLAYLPHLDQDLADEVTQFLFMAALHNENQTIQNAAIEGLGWMTFANHGDIPHLQFLVDLIRKNREKVSPYIANQLLVNVIEPMIFRVPAAFTDSLYQGLVDNFGHEPSFYYALFYLAHRFEVPDSVRSQALQRVQSSQLSFIHRQIYHAVGEGRKDALIIQNIYDGMGDELVRVWTFAQALLEYNPQLRLTIVTDRPHLYDHPRVTTVPMTHWQTKRNHLHQTFDVVVDHYDPQFAYDNELETRFDESRHKSSPLFIRTSKPDDDFLFDEVNLSGVAYASTLALNRKRVSNVYEPTYRLLARLGIPFLASIDQPKHGSLLVGKECSVSFAYEWRDLMITLKNLTPMGVMRRPILAVAPFGGMHPLKGLFDWELRVLPVLLQYAIPLGNDMVILPNGTEWGNHEIAQAMIAKHFYPEEREHMVVAKDPQNMDARFTKYFIYYAGIWFGIEGGLMHLAFSLGKPLTVFPLRLFGREKWIPFGRGIVQSLSFPRPPSKMTGSLRNRLHPDPDILSDMRRNGRNDRNQVNREALEAA